MDADTIRRRRVAGLELRAEFAGGDAARFIDLPDPSASEKIEVVVHRPLDDVGPEAEPPRVGVASQGFSEKTEVFAEGVSLDEDLAVPSRRHLRTKDAEDALVRSSIG